MTPSSEQPPETWRGGATDDDAAERREAYRRLAAAARRVGLPVDRLHVLLTHLARNETETRRFLSREVYGVPDEILDDMIRLRLRELDEEGPGGGVPDPGRNR